jgi:SAM-dependent methyltransferase
MTDPLLGLAMWTTWQDQVVAALPHYAASPWYLEQDSLPPEAVNAVASAMVVRVRDGATRDLAHGARAFATDIGVVTRAWVDGNIEIDFLRRQLRKWTSSWLDVLDIGAGYGRLAVMLAPSVGSYTCVDAVPVSVEVCRDYTRRYAPSVRVLSVAELRQAMIDPTFRPNLAINIHSWNECSLDQIAAWLDVLDALEVTWLFTVSHGQNPDVPVSETSYRAWGPGEFKTLLLDRYNLKAEESIGISQNPHALWRRRAA